MWAIEFESPEPMQSGIWCVIQKERVMKWGSGVGSTRGVGGGSVDGNGHGHSLLYTCTRFLTF